MEKISVKTIHIHFNLGGFVSLAKLLLGVLTVASQAIEAFMFRMVGWYDLYIYTPLQIHLSPYMACIPRTVRIGDKDVTVFTANIVTYSRTLLIIPIAWCLKFDHPVLACLLVLFHDFLDHVDGIVAKVQKRIYGEVDDPLLGGFMDAFCDKIVNIFCLWTIIQETNFQHTSLSSSIAFVLLCYIIIGLETAIGIIRVQDYFVATLTKTKTASQGVTAAGMEGKLKEKLESMGLAFLCLSTGHLAPFDHWSGIAGVICFALTVRLACLSLIKKLQAREPKKTETMDIPTITTTQSSNPTVQKSIAVINVSETSTDTKSRSDSTSSSEAEDQSPQSYQRSASLPAIWLDARADKVYTIGCFDLFHEGHIRLLQRMRQYGREVIVGVHCSRSIHKLKSRVPVDGTEVRMLNVKRYADQVFCVAGTDPSNFIQAAVHLRPNETALYIRGDDMAEFPSRKVVEALMPVQFLPYTSGVSSTQLRKERFSHIKADDIEHLEKVN